jgi:hypothetical protein
MIKKKLPTDVPTQIVIDGETWEITPKLRKILVKAKKIAPHATYRELLTMYLQGSL